MKGVYRRRFNYPTNRGLRVVFFPVGGAPAPTITSINPTTGAFAGGTAVTITGTGFQTGATVTFDGIPATSVVVVNDTTITCVTPAF